MLALISVGFLYLSYRHPNTLVFEIESIVAFIGALVLIFKDSTRSVQLRVVTRIADSAQSIIEGLATSGATRGGFHYVSYGHKISDVFVVPINSSPLERGTVSTFGLSEKDVQRLKFVPPGRGLAELFEREVGVSQETLPGTLEALPDVLAESFELVASAVVNRDGNRVEVKLVRPLLKQSCADTSLSVQDGRIGCPICSMIAILLCKYSGSPVVIEGCKYVSLTDQKTMTLRFEATTKESPPEGVAS